MRIINSSTLSRIMPCVATIGFFDGVHRGHRFLIEMVAQTARNKGLCSLLVTFTQHPRKVLREDYCPSLLTTESEKVTLLQTTQADYCVLLPFTTQLSLLTAKDFMLFLKKKCNVQCLVMGYDHHFGHGGGERFEDYVRYGMEIDMEVIRARACDAVCEDDHTLRLSSSAIRKLLNNGQVAQASLYLGYNYLLSGHVVKGQGIGHKLGFPTANVEVDDCEKLIPANGVYAVEVVLDNRVYRGVLSIGVRPTIGNDLSRSIEVHILRFNADIYSRSIQVRFVKRLRSEMKFADTNALASQLIQDTAQADLALQVYQSATVRCALSGQDTSSNLE